MKLSKLLCATAVACVAISASAVSAMAAQKFDVGAPIDLATGKAATLEAGQYIAIPVDVTSETGDISSVQFVAAYDSALTPGVLYNSDEELPAEISDRVDEFGACVDFNGKCVFVDTNYYTKKGFNFSNADNVLVNDNYEGKTMVGLSYNTNATLAAGPEFYAVFTVNSDVTALNTELLTVDNENSSINVTNKGQATNNNPVEQEKANACAGAFQLVLKDAELTTYIHNLYVSVNGGAAVQITDYVSDTEGEYKFPVRLTDNSGNLTSVEVVVTADVGTTAEAVTENGKEIGKFTLDLTTAPTSYTSQSIK